MDGYNQLIVLIQDTKKFQYDCTILRVFASDYMWSVNEDVELESFLDPLIHYFTSTGCDDTLVFKQVIDLLDDIIISGRKIDKFDVQYILNEEDTNAIIRKFNLGYVAENVLFNKLKRNFDITDVTDLLKVLKIRWAINVQI